MADATTVELLAAGNQAASGQGAEKDIGALRTAARVFIDVSAVTGVASVTVDVQTRSTVNSTWSSVKREICGGAARHEIVVGKLGRYVRVAWTLGAGVTVYLAITAEAHALYCEPRQVSAYALPASAIESVPPDTLLNVCIAASCSAEDYIGSSYTMPLVAWPESVRMQTARLIAAMLLSGRGTDPDGPDKLVFDAEASAIKWFSRIADGKLKPPGLIDSTPEVFEGGSVVVSTPDRGW